MPFTLRLARPAEHDRVAELTIAAYTADYTDLPEQYLRSLGEVAERAARGQVWVAVDDDTGRIVGTMATGRPGGSISALARDDELDFRLLAVDPSARKRGVAQALVGLTERLARERGLARVVLNSGPEMLGAHALYAKLGFARVAERELAVEVEPGVFVVLYVFARDVPPAP